MSKKRIACAEAVATETESPPTSTTFYAELRALINRHSRDSATPDYILADYLERCLLAFESAVIFRDCHQERGEM